MSDGPGQPPDELDQVPGEPDRPRNLVTRLRGIAALRSGDLPARLRATVARRRGRPRAVVRGMWWRRHAVRAAVAVVMIFALLGPLAGWPSPPGPDRTPFDAAVAALASVPAVQYRSTAGADSWDVRVTRFGDAVGTITIAGQPVPIMTIGGRTYLKSSPGALSDLGSSVADDAQGQQWSTGTDVTTDASVAPVLRQLRAPAALAYALRTILAGTPTSAFPVDADKNTSTVDGVPALMVPTTVGALYVSRNAPNRVLRLTGLGAVANQSPQLPAMLSGVVSNVTVQPPRPEPVAAGAVGADDLSQVGDLSPTELAGPATDQAYQDIDADIPQLADSQDDDIQATLDAQAQLSCSSAGCLVTGDVSSEVSGAPAGSSPSGTVTADLTATVTVDGIDAGGCTSTASIPLGGTGSISCDDTEAGGVWAAELAQRGAAAQAEADAEAAVSGYASVPYEVDGDGHAEVSAETHVDPQPELQREEGEQDEIDACLADTPNSFVPGTPVLLADGTSRPIEQLTPGTQVLSADPATGRTMAEPVTARIVGSGWKQLATITLTEGGRSGTVTATGNHPFWDPAQQRWVDAGHLDPGEHLADVDGGRPIVVGITGPVGRDLTVYNLTVADLHTYYVEVVGIPILVHNAGGPGPCELGKQGEAAAGISKNTTKIQINGRRRIPDQLDPNLHTIGEVKNVAYQYLSTQLKDDIAYAEANGYIFTLYTRVDTQLSPQLENEIANGTITLEPNLPSVTKP